MKKILSVSCAFLLLTSTVLVDCKKEPESYIQAEEPTSFEATENVLVENFKSDYKIVIPEKSTKMEAYAAQELQYFLCESTGCTLEIITDKDLPIDTSNKYLSIGDTTLLGAQTDIKLDAELMGDTSPSIDTVGNSVFMAGTASYGILNSVYKFLEYQIGYKAYAYDCVKYDYYSKLYLLDFNYHYVPSIDYLATNEFELDGKALTQEAARLNVFGSDSGGTSIFDGGLFSGLWCHTVAVIVPSVNYPWAYNNSQMCMSDPRVLKIFCENFTMMYALSATGPFAMIGGIDNENVCDCADCSATIGKYGSGGLMSIFINKVADYVEKYFQEHNIDKKLCLVGLYYLGYDEIPAVANEDGTYSAVDESVIPDSEGNVTAGICYAPMLACYTHPFGEGACEKNKFYTEGFKKAAALTDDLFIYIYGANVSAAYDQVYFFNNWSTWEANFRFFDDIGVRFVNEEANRWGIRQLSSLNIYVRSRLAWDSSTKIEESVEEFIDAYYGVAADLMRDYYDAIMEHYQSVYGRTKTYCESIYSPSVSAKTYPHQVFLNYAAILESAMHVIERSNLPEEQKAIYYERVEREWYIVKVQEYHMHQTAVDKEYLAELEDIFEKSKEKYTIWVSRKSA